MIERKGVARGVSGAGRSWPWQTATTQSVKLAISIHSAAFSVVIRLTLMRVGEKV